VQLTLTAVKIAGGDLEQSVSTNRRDEIGILAQAFNIMTAELRTLYHNLEQKVVERTLQLQEANQQLRYQTMQLTLSAEVGHAITSILDLDQLLQKVVELILDSYRLLRVTIYLLDESGHHIVRQARSDWGGSRFKLDGSRTVFPVSLVGRAVTDGQSHLDNLHINAAIPLRVGQRVIGVLELRASQGDEFSKASIDALQSLCDQVSVAVQNAQTYAVERSTVERLRRLDQTRTQSLGNMSRELATSLNTIIGFSRLILKGVDGPLTEQQHSDVSVINRSGQHLLGLLDDILELVNLESSDHPLEQTFVKLNQIVADVFDQIAPLARDKSIILRSECASDLPPVQADDARLHQALAYLVSDTIETVTVQTASTGKDSQANTVAGQTSDAITVGARLVGKDGDEVMISVASGPGVLGANGRDGFEGFYRNLRNDLSGKDFVWDGTDSGIKLMLSKRIIELHGGHLWVSGPAHPVKFVFTLPVTRMGSSKREPLPLPKSAEEAGRTPFSHSGSGRQVEDSA
jgi:signal transduction histidine kinase